MIKLHITGLNYELDEKIKRYIEHKLGRLDKYLPRNTKNPAGKVVLEEDVSGREDNRFVCEFIVKLPGHEVMAKEATVSFYAAVDIVEAKAKIQFLKYKDKHQGEKRRVRTAVRNLFGHEEESS